MLPARLTAYLRYFAGLALQPANRWDGFDLSAPDSRHTSLRDQIFFVGCALAVLARHPEATPEESSLATAALVDVTDRLIQRRVWAVWAAEIERGSQKPDPVDMGYGAYTGALSMLFGLQAAVGGTVPYVEDPFVLRWSAYVCPSYTVGSLAHTLWHEAQESPDGALRCWQGEATASGMTALLWALRLHDRAYGSVYGGLEETWLKTLTERMRIRGPRLFNPHTFANSFNLRHRRANGTGESLEDAWTLALLAPLQPELVAGLVERHWAALAKIREPLPLAFSYLLAVELGETQRAADLLANANGQLRPLEDEEIGRRYSDVSAAPWITALYAMGEAGGMGQVLA